MNFIIYISVLPKQSHSSPISVLEGKLNASKPQGMQCTLGGKGIMHPMRGQRMHTPEEALSPHSSSTCSQKASHVTLTKLNKTSGKLGNGAFQTK